MTRSAFPQVNSRTGQESWSSSGVRTPGREYVLTGEITRVGRHPDSEIFLDDVTVSRRHAEFRRESGHYVVADIGSLNGTYVNRERIEAATLKGGDEVQVGKFKLVFLSTSQG